MQGKKTYQEKMFTSFQLSEHVPKDNFYRRLKSEIDFHFLYSRTEQFYGSSGQKSIDPVVFFKLCLVGYLENIISDRKLIDHCSLRLDILYFLGYDIDEPLPWHSTMSRTRQLFPESLFEQVFNTILDGCISKGMVSGKIQAIDSAPVKANASMDSLELKVPEESLDDHIRKVRVMSACDRKAKNDKASKDQQTISASDRELNEIKSRNKKWSKDQDQRPGSKAKGSKYTSNKTHYSPTDPDARISVKPGKARKLNYLSQMSVDTSHHVITHIHADYADKKDNQCLQYITENLNGAFIAEDYNGGTYLQTQVTQVERIIHTLSTKGSYLTFHHMVPIKVDLRDLFIIKRVIIGYVETTKKLHFERLPLRKAKTTILKDFT